jgi:hypothetical protein
LFRVGSTGSIYVPISWLGVTAIGAGALWLGEQVFLPHLTFALTILAFVVLPFSIYANLWNSMMIGMGQIWRVNLLQIVMCMFSLSLTTIFVVVLAGGVRAAATIYLVVMALQFLVMLIMQLRISHEVSSNDLPPDLARKMLSLVCARLYRFHLPSALDANSSFLSTSLMARPR